MSIIGPNNKEIVFLVQRECCQCNLVPPWHYDWFSMRGFFPVFLITVFKRRQNRMSNLFWNGRFPNSLRSIWPGLFLDFKQIIVSCSSTRIEDIKSRKGYSPHPDDKLVDALGIFHNLTPVHHHLVIMMMMIMISQSHCCRNEINLNLDLARIVPARLGHHWLCL